MYFTLVKIKKKVFTRFFCQKNGLLVLKSGEFVKCYLQKQTFHQNLPFTLQPDFYLV